ncbi:MAG TPA: lipoyl(octanoyl) transferase LipB [Woeseiaceae bacterium]|jgi:lipoyl(octanoyl) transferase|nr:lipoyl(octanoyl) transferase LipB [Woeseiaceae bacterium]
MTATPRISVSWLGRQPYEPLWREMQAFTEARDPGTADELWFAEHPPVFTLGLAARREHVLAPGDIPVVQTDRGGQVTYHGPGQLMVYPLVDLRRAGIGVRVLVTALERSVVDLLAVSGIQGEIRPTAPGVYVADRKLASVGLRVRRGASYHGMALNVDLDLEPFTRIDPCGYAGLEMTDLARLGIQDTLPAIAARLEPLFVARL